ncbi:DegV family protein [Candidatus Poriferisocius sp.]|uniref:DegV family protein n=1 Tax=Candidatus Poriferisocius sp. TaxID=3101276 RepID=UPI003B59BFB1
MPVGVVTDSTAALPAEVRDRWDIGVVPLAITVDGRTVADGQLDTAEILGARNHSSSSPSPGAFAQAIAQCDQGQGVVVVTVSSTLSSTHQSAVLAAKGATGPVAVVDSRTAAGGQALVAVAAARAAAAGMSLDEVVDRAEWVARRVKLVGALGNLDQLIRSGRVPGLAGRAGNRLGLRPLFDIRDGAIGKLRPALSDEAAHQRIIGIWRRTRPADATGRLHLVSLHAEVPERAAELLAAVTAEATPADAFISGFGQAMMINSGTGVRGLAWYWDEPG